MLKKSASFVLASLRDSTYDTKYDSPLRSLRPCWTGFLSILMECFVFFMMSRPLKACCDERVFPQPANADEEDFVW